MYLGIDIGTSAVKAALFCPHRGAVGSAAAAIAFAAPRPAWCEQDPQIWWEAAVSACRRLSARQAKAWRAVKAVGLSGQMHGAVCLDRAGRVLRPAILWNDGRSHAEAAALANAFPELGRLAGVRPMPGFTAPKILWMKKHEPDNYARLRRILLPKDYVRWRLAHTALTDVSDAAGTWWLDQARRQWSARLCAASATNPDWLPDCVEGCAAGGELTRAAAAALDLRPGLLLAGGGGDAASGAVSIGAVNAGDTFISLGTSGQIFAVTETCQPCLQNAVHAFAHCVPGRWYQMAALLNGASPLQWLARLVGERIEVLLERAAAAPPDDELLFLPYLCGERTPHDNPHARGGFYGLSHAASQASLTRAVIEGIAYAFCEAAQALREAGSALDNPAVIGGGARGDLLVQTLADALDLRLARHPDMPAGPALGAARLAALADGAMHLSDIVRPEAARVFAPQPAQRGRHQQRLGRFREMYRALAATAGAPD